MSETPDLPFVLLCESCGQPGVRLSERPAYGSVASSSIVYHLDGRKVERGERAVCDACGESLWRALVSSDYPSLFVAGGPKSENVRDASDYDIAGAPV